MIKRTLLAVLALCVAFVLGGVLSAQEPQVNVGEKHGNMRAAQELIQLAWRKVDEAQADNNYNLGGHATKAKEFLLKASIEIKSAAESAKPHH